MARTPAGEPAVRMRSRGRTACRYGVGMGLSLPEKLSAFCHELGTESLLTWARQNDMEVVYSRARRSLLAGQIDTALEADIDSLNAAIQQADGEGLYPAADRSYTPLPGTNGSTGARWWTCPAGRCSGRGRVRPGQRAPVCTAIGQPLEAGPLPG